MLPATRPDGGSNFETVIVTPPEVIQSFEGLAAMWPWRIKNVEQFVETLPSDLSTFEEAVVTRAVVASKVWMASVNRTAPVSKRDGEFGTSSLSTVGRTSNGVFWRGCRCCFDLSDFSPTACSEASLLAQ